MVGISIRIQETIKVLLALALLLLVLGFFPSGTQYVEAATLQVDPATDDLKSIVEGANSGDVVHLLPGTHVVTATINIPAGVTIRSKPNSEPESVVVQGGNNSSRLNIFQSNGSNIAISGIKFVPDPAASLGGRAVWLSLGGGGLSFHGNTVDSFTDGVFARSLAGGTLEFYDNRLTIVDRDPNSNSGFLGGNAGLTVLFSNLDGLNASGNTLHGPGRNVDRFIAVVGIIIFNTSQTIETISLSDNDVSGFDFGIFTSGQVGASGAVVEQNKLHNNGVAIGVGQVPDPDITIPTPADNTLISQNRITGNDFGVFIAANAQNTTLRRNQIAGNSEAPIIDDSAAGETTLEENLIRGKNTGNRPDGPPGQAFDPVTG